MKSSLIVVAAIVTFTACTSNPDTNSETKREIVADTSAKYNSSTLTDTATAMPGVSTVPAMEEKTVQPKKAVVKSNAAAKPAPVTGTPTPVTTEPAATPVPAVTDNATTTTEPEVAPAEEKKGWSNSAKGAVIGAGAGAIGGAIISKKKAKGAIIGGVIGAAGGYIIGKNKDNKDTIK